MRLSAHSDEAEHMTWDKISGGFTDETGNATYARPKKSIVRYEMINQQQPTDHRKQNEEPDKSILTFEDILLCFSHIIVRIPDQAFHFHCVLKCELSGIYLKPGIFTNECSQLQNNLTKIYLGMANPGKKIGDNTMKNR